MTAANTPTSSTPPRRGSWIRAIVTLADGRKVELILDGAVAGAVSTCAPPADGSPSLTVVVGGQRRRGRLNQILGD